MSNNINDLERILDKDSLKVELSFMAIFIGLFEYLKDTVCSRVESFLCTDMTRTDEGELVWVHTEEYKSEIEKRIVDGKVVKDRLRNTMLWYKEAGALTEKDYVRFLELRKKRNSYAHEMTTHILDGLPEQDMHALIDLLELFRKLDQWWINEVEIPISGDFEPGSYQEDEVESMALITFKMLISTLFVEGKSEEYLEMLRGLNNQNLTNDG